ncbi:MAG: glycosyltransferase [Lachnospiraceae bacterium]|nr:glycosyltransferase [Lachnospiraceae bacterium]
MYTYEVDVTVVCVAHNDGATLNDCLNVLCNQKTNFTYKVFAINNASTDNSQEIIESYYMKYPEIMVPMTLKEYEPSLGRIIMDKVEPMVVTNYLAFCNGSEFWCDKGKLQVQYDYMGINADVLVCAHNTLIRDVTGEVKSKTFTEWKNIKVLTEEEAYMEDAPFLSSYLVRNSLVQDALSVADYEFYNYAFSVWGRANGKVAVLPATLSIYPVHGSDEKSDSEKIEFLQKKYKFLEDFDRLTHFSHKRIIGMAKDKFEFEINLIKLENDELSNGETSSIKKALKESGYLKTYMSSMSFGEKIKFKMKL